MNNNHKVIEYGIPNGKLIGTFGLDHLAEVIREIIQHKNIVLQHAESGEMMTFDRFDPYHVTAIIKLCENALVFKFEEHNDQFEKHEDAGKSELYIFNDEIVYVVTEVDPRVNKEYKVNETTVNRLENKAGMVIQVPPLEKQPSTLGEKLKYFFTAGKRKKLKKLREDCLNKINISVNRLDSVTDIEKK